MKRRVMVLYPLSIPWMARCVDGIRQYSDSQGGWNIFSTPLTMPGMGETTIGIDSIRDWKGDGIILATSDVSDLKKAKKLNIPVINLAGGIQESHGIPRVMVNHYLAGRMAADHLHGTGLRNLAFFGWNNLWYSEQRQIGFEERSAELGVSCNTYLITPDARVDSSWAERIAVCSKWLLSLEHPCGVFAVQDYRAQFLMEACQELNLRIPDDIAILGMDNDVTVCEHSIPTLSSISRSSEEVGWQAASLLERLMNREPIPNADLYVKPDNIVSRQSTDLIFCSDQVVQCAIQFMKSNLKVNFSISELAENLQVSKRTLELKFASKVKASPHEFLVLLRIKQAQKILLSGENKQTIREIYSECGFITGPTFYSAFKRLAGQSPADYRKTRSLRMD